MAGWLGWAGLTWVASPIKSDVWSRPHVGFSRQLVQVVRTPRRRMFGTFCHNAINLLLTEEKSFGRKVKGGEAERWKGMDYIEGNLGSVKKLQTQNARGGGLFSVWKRKEFRDQSSSGTVLRTVHDLGLNVEDFQGSVLGLPRRTGSTYTQFWWRL